MKSIRIATFNVSMYGKQAGEIRHRLSGREDAQARKLAGIVQTVRPDLLLLNEIDYEQDSIPAQLLAENYFAVGQRRADDSGVLQPIEYPYVVSFPSNTGIASQMDLNQDGQLGSGNDAWGYGTYPGQYAMAVMSRFPIERDAIRSFQHFRWAEMPDAKRPIDPKTAIPYYPDTIWSRLRLSSKNHVDVPVRIGRDILHLLVSHPTPPVFDGPEDRNGARNHDEIMFWIHYLDNDPSALRWLIDDDRRTGGLATGKPFVLMGDLNADPDEGSGRREAIRRLLDHDRVNDVRPRASASEPGGDVDEPRNSKTADFGRNGLMRVDYVLPGKNLVTVDSGVFWPSPDDPRRQWISASDHRLVWVDVEDRWTRDPQ